MFQDIQKLCGYFGLASSSLLVSGSILQSPCNLETFGYSYIYKWICLILFSSPTWKTFQNFHQVSTLQEVALCPLALNHPS